jgi:tripartite ATP-independent transporter DctP family solute receptor
MKPLSFIQSLLLTAALAGAGTALAQQKTLKFANQNAPGHPVIQGMERFKALVEERSQGRIRVNVFPSGQLGSDQANVSALQAGTLEMASMNSGIYASIVPDFVVYDFPFMFANSKEADAVVDGPFGRRLHAMLEDKGLVGLGYYELGFRHMTNGRRPIVKVADIQGLKLRVIPNAINVDWVKALGANPTPLPWPEVYAALEQRAVDGQENPIPTINGAKFFEVQKHLTLTGHQYNPQSIVISKKIWDGLSAAERTLLSNAAAESAVFQRAKARELEASLLDNLKKNGMQVTELPAAEMQVLRDRMKPVIAKHGEKVAGTVSALQTELERLRK